MFFFFYYNKLINKISIFNSNSRVSFINTKILVYLSFDLKYTINNNIFSKAIYSYNKI
jgi:hypothetical protein